MSEADIRAEIIDVIIARLGYKYGEINDVERERQLIYPFAQIGHKSKKDVPIGHADYICKINGRRGSFAVEAKRGNVQINQQDIIQAHSYAAHSEIGANFFVVCNGHIIKIFETLNGLKDGPIVEIPNEKFEIEFYKIESLLSPGNLKRYSTKNYEITKPIYQGSPASLEIKNGWITFRDVKHGLVGYPLGTFEQLLAKSGELQKFQTQIQTIKDRRQPIIGGKIGRDRSGRIFAHVEFDSADELLAKNLQSMKLTELTFLTENEQISTDPDMPSVFESVSENPIPTGTKLYDLTTKFINHVNYNTKIKQNYEVIGYSNDNTFVGLYKGRTIIEFSAIEKNIVNLEILMHGDFTINFK